MPDQLGFDAITGNNGSSNGKAKAGGNLVAAGRPKGAKNKITREINALVKARGIGFLSQMWDRAERLEDEIDFKCAVFLGARIWPKARSAPVQIDISQVHNPQTILAAMAAGDLTPPDAAALVRAIEGNVGSRSGVKHRVLEDPRGALMERITKLIEHRRRSNGEESEENGNGA